MREDPPQGRAYAVPTLDMHRLDPKRMTSLNDIARPERTRREILLKSDLVPSLPDSVRRLLWLLSKPETEITDLVQQIQTDLVLVGKMLAMANSPFYGQSRAVRTIKEALMVLGFRSVRSLVLATSSARFMQRDFTCYGHDAKGLWAHSACVAATSRFLAKACDLSADVAEESFVAGLLHDIGKVLLAPFMSNALCAHLVSSNSTCEVERRAIGIDHTEAGALVCAKWNLSHDLQGVLRAHHDKAAASDPRLVAVVRLADSVAHEYGYGYVAGLAPRAVDLCDDLSALSLSAATWNSLRNALSATMTEAVASLSATSG